MFVREALQPEALHHFGQQTLPLTHPLSPSYLATGGVRHVKLR
jgi:hypothetical protein